MTLIKYPILKHPNFEISPNVTRALSRGEPVVALE